MKKLAKCLRKKRQEGCLFFFKKVYNIRMKTIKELKIKDWSCYFFKEMVNILDIEPEYFMNNDFKDCKDGSTIFNMCYSSEDSVLHIVFNNIECIFRKSGVFSYLIFCESDKNKIMLDYYVKIIDQMKEEILSWTDESDYFMMGKDFMRFRFRTDDELVYNKVVNIPVCVMSLSSVIKKGDIYYPQFELQRCFYEN